MRALAQARSQHAPQHAQARATRIAPRIQPQLRIGPVDDPLEREADRMADAVMAGDFAGAASGDEDPSVRRACCSACSSGDKEEDVLRRKAAPSPAGACAAEPISTSAGKAAAALVSGGARLPAPLRSYFEPRFGQDFSHVRLHTGTSAAHAASAIGARAYTLGRDIAFVAGEYAPGTSAGRRLLAHELAHVAQQAPFIARQPAPHHRRRFTESGGGGNTIFEETVQDAPVRTGDIIEGRVERREFAPAAAAGGAERDVKNRPGDAPDRVRVRYDARACEMTLPFVFNFVERQTASSGGCQEPLNDKTVPALPAARLTAISQEYVEAVNRHLNGWYKLRLTGCKNPCADKLIPILVQASAGTTNVDTTINVVNRGGRGDAGNICAKDFNSGFAAHEGGHQILGVGDEYAERDPALLTTMPQWGTPGRVRTDLSRMNTSGSRFALFHERHFRFAQVFMEAAFPGCTVELVEQSRPIIPSFFVNASLGYAGAFGGGGFFAPGLDIGLDLPLMRLRQIELELGVSGRALLTADSHLRNAFLAGARVGISARPLTGTTPDINLGVVGGVIHQPERARLSSPILPASTSGFVEGTLGIGIAGGIDMPLFIRAEAGIGAEIRNDPDALRWFRTGIVMGGSF